MDGENKGLLDLELERVTKELDALYPGQDGYLEATERLDKLYRLKIEERKAESEMQARANEEKRERKQLFDGKWDRWIRFALDAASILVPAIGYSYWMGRGLRFEETGSYSSRTDQMVSKHFRFGK